MNLYVFNGTEHKNGNLQYVSQELLKETEQKRDYSVAYNSITFKPCISCGVCRTTGKCILPDSPFMNPEEIRKSDAIVILSPIYFFNFSAKAKSFIDRLYAHDLSGKILTAITVSGSPTDDRYCGFDIVEEMLIRTCEYCGAEYVEPVNFVTEDKKIEYNIRSEIQSFVERLEECYHEIKKG